MHKHRVETHSPSRQLPFSARSVSLVRSTLPRLGLLWSLSKGLQLLDFQP